MEAFVFAFISDSIIILSDMSTFFFPRLSKRSVLLWRALQPLRPSCSRSTTFLWLVVVLAALCLRPDLAGVTSLVRGLGLSEASYYGLLHLRRFLPTLNLWALGDMLCTRSS